jgi:hypothetical protein
LSINSTGQITTNAGTEVNWAFIINSNQCEDNSDGNPYACQPPTYPAPTVSVGTTISPLGTSGSASSGCGWGCAQLALTAQASQAGTYTETSNHSAYFPPSGDNLAGQTQQQQSYTPPQPTITSVSPSTWYTGTSTSVTISGSNFGSSPTVSLSGDNYATWTAGTASADGTTITGTVAISPSDPGGETVDITVTAGGSGNGFLGGEQQGAQSQPATASVAASCPQTVSLVQVTPLALQTGVSSTQNFPACLTGFGAYVTLQVADPSGKNWNGTNLSETVNPQSNTCPAQTIACDTGGNTFAVGQAPSFGTSLYGLTLPAFPTQNGFWDLHTSVGSIDILTKLQQGDPCEVVCTQTYSCGGTQLKIRFRARRFYGHEKCHTHQVKRNGCDRRYSDGIGAIDL